MKTSDIKRMNFLVRSKRAFTYRTMLHIFIGWFILIALFYGFEVVIKLRVENRIKRANSRIAALDKQKEEYLVKIRKISREKSGETAKLDLASIIEKRPRWSKVITEITSKLGVNIWLDTIDVELKDGIYRIQISGRSKTQSSLASFIRKLDAGGYFRGTKLLNSELVGGKKGIFYFDVEMEPIRVNI